MYDNVWNLRFIQWICNDLTRIWLVNQGVWMMKLYTWLMWLRAFFFVHPCPIEIEQIYKYIFLYFLMTKYISLMWNWIWVTKKIVTKPKLDLILILMRWIFVLFFSSLSRVLCGKATVTTVTTVYSVFCYYMYRTTQKEY